MKNTMSKLSAFFKFLTPTEWIIWGLSTAATIACFFAFGNTQYHYLAGALIGFAALVLVSKGNPVGQGLVIVFAVFYGIISYSFGYYGEMITYIGMSAPIAVAALVSWLRHPFDGKKSEVKVDTLSGKEWGIFAALSVAVTVAFYFILRVLGTSNLEVSTASVLTSFAAAYLTARRSRFYAVGYAVNDVVLIALWAMASADEIMYLPMVVCFVAFLALDLYGFVNWSRMYKKQRSIEQAKGGEACGAPAPDGDGM